MSALLELRSHESAGAREDIRDAREVSKGKRGLPVRLPCHCCDDEGPHEVQHVPPGEPTMACGECGAETELSYFEPHRGKR